MFNPTSPYCICYVNFTNLSFFIKNNIALHIYISTDSIIKLKTTKDVVHTTSKKKNHQ